jgi:hypothetical protein
MTRTGIRHCLRSVLVTVLAVSGLGLAVGQAVAADDVATAWSVSPAGEDGKADSRTRFELEADPGATSTIKVVVSNASTVERTFDVYGADALNTSSGGYDLQPAATVPVDVGAWLTPATPTVTIPALSDAVVDVAVAVPDGATTGDHPGGVVVSLDGLQAGADGVILDTRVAVRLNVRVAGELTPALVVRSVTASSGASWVPFASTTTTIRYEVANTGNVKIIGRPRVRVTGPFGVRLVTRGAENTQEILPGRSFTVESTLPGVVPLGVLTAVVDVDMAAAPGAETEIPLVSTTASATFFAVSWTGLLLVVGIALLVGYVVRTLRRRRRDAEELWRHMTSGGGADLAEAQPAPDATGSDAVLTGRGPAQSGTAAISVVVLALVVGGALLSGMAGVAWAGPAAATPVAGSGSDDRTITLSVPAEPSGTTAGTAGTPGTAAPDSRAVSAGHSAAPSSGVVPTGDATESAAGPTPAPTARAARPAPDLVWLDRARHLGPVGWSLVGLGGLGITSFVGLAIRHAVVSAALVRGAAA